MARIGDRRSSTLASWFGRLAVAWVFFVNVQCALQFLFDPAPYASSFELSGGGAVTAVSAVGLLFLMWNVTYVPVMANPRKYRTIFGVVLVQQLIGVVGESVLLARLAEGHGALAGSIAHFIWFDAIGLGVMLAAFLAVLATATRDEPSAS